MCDEAVIVEDIGCVFLGGPPLVKAATGEVVEPMDLGGALVHCEVSGCTDHFAADEDEAFEIGRAIVETLPRWEYAPSACEAALPPRFESEGLVDLMESGEVKAGSARRIIARIVDDSRVHEHRTRYGKTLFTAFARIGGTWLVSSQMMVRGEAVKSTRSPLNV